MPKIILLVDCDNQSANRAKDLFDVIDSDVGILACAFLFGIARGQQVRAWKSAVQRRHPGAIVDAVIAANRKQSADARLIMKIGFLGALFEPGSAAFLVVTSDAQILAAAEILPDMGHRIFAASMNGQNMNTSLPIIDVA